MTIVFAAAVVTFLAGAITGAILLVSLASLREDRNRLSRKAPDRVAMAGRFVTGLRVADPGTVPARRGRRSDRQVTMTGPHQDWSQDRF